MRKLLLIVVLIIFSSCHNKEGTTKIIAFGDSLTAGYGVTPEQAFPKVLEAMLKKEGHDAIVLNYGISGDTTLGGRNRIESVLNANLDTKKLNLPPPPPLEQD